MEEMPPRLFRVPKKMWNEWTLNLRDGQSQQIFFFYNKNLSLSLLLYISHKYQMLLWKYE